MMGNTSSLLDSWIHDFDLNQSEAYNCDGNCVVIAGPGSGKTRVLVARTARLLAHRALGPRGVACITYSEETAKELENRFEKLGIADGNRLFVGTVHSFCLSCVAAPFGHLIQHDLCSDMTVAGIRQQDQALRKALDELGLGGSASNWKRRVEYFRRTHPVREKGWGLDDPELARLTETYICGLRSKGLIDFDDIVGIALHLISEHEFVRSSLEARFPFLAIDEYQDLGYPLHLMAGQFVRNSGIEVFAVGDPDQSIYGFAGANPKYLYDLASVPDVHVVNLKFNYRSTQQIIDGSQLVLTPQEPKEFSSRREDSDEGFSFIRCRNGLTQQAELIATRLIPYLLQQGVPEDQIAVLYIDKFDATPLRRALAEDGIKFNDERAHNIPNTPFFKWLTDVATWCASYPETEQGPDTRDLFGRYTMFKRDVGISVSTEDLSAYSTFFGALVAATAPGMSLSNWLERLDSLLNITSMLQEQEIHSDDLEDWNSIIQDCKTEKALANYGLDDFASRRNRPGAITLTTLHSSKGREFQVVIMPGLEEGRLPKNWSNSEEDIAESGRLFYVGMTRAKESVYMLNSGWYRDGFGNIHEEGPSRFVSKLQAVLGQSNVYEL